MVQTRSFCGASAVFFFWEGANTEDTTVNTSSRMTNRDLNAEGIPSDTMFRKACRCVCVRSRRADSTLSQLRKAKIKTFMSPNMLLIVIMWFYIFSVNHLTATPNGWYLMLLVVLRCC